MKSNTRQPAPRTKCDKFFLHTDEVNHTPFITCLLAKRQVAIQETASHLARLGLALLHECKP